MLEFDDNYNLLNSDDYKIIFKKDIIEDNDGQINSKQYILLKKIQKYKQKITENIKQSKKRYFQNNKEEIIQKNSLKLKEKCDNDPEYKERLKQQKRESYLRKKEEKKLKKIFEAENI